MPDTSRRFFFVHVPSCGGTTIWSVLKAGFGKGRVRRITQADEPAAEYLDPYRGDAPEARRPMIGGHFSYAVASSALPDRTFVSLVRDPVERALSNYARHLRNGKRAVGDAYGEDFLRFQRETLPLGKIGRNLAPEGLATRHAPPTPEELAGIKDAISCNFALIGLTERFNESLFLMRDLFGWDEVPLYDRRNVGASKPDAITPAIRARAAEICAVELEIHAHVVAEFDRRWAAFRTPAVDADLAAYEARLQQREAELLAEHGGVSPFLKA